MLRVIIVDDERLARDALKSLLEHIAFVEVVGEAESIQTTIEQVKEKKPHLLLMDIHLGNENGFDFFKTLENPPIVAFVTAHTDYAIRAFSVNSIDYLVKPVSLTRLEETINRARTILSYHSAKESINPKTIELKTPGRALITKIDDIAALYSERDFTNILLVQQPRIMVYRTLTSLENLLQEQYFLRLGRSIIINLNCVEHIKIHLQSGASVSLKGVKEELEIGQTAAQRLRLALKNT